MIYTYNCEECKKTKEVDIPMKEDNPRRLKCPKCNKMSMYQVMGNTGSSIIIPKHFVNDSNLNFKKKIHKKYY